MKKNVFEKRIVIIGSAHETITDKIRELCGDLGKYLAVNQITVYTGACSGIPHIVGKKIVDEGGTVIGFSPATNIDEHCTIYNFPIDGCSEIIFSKAKYSHNDGYIFRSKEMLEYSNVVVSIQGNWGTLNELIFSVLCSKYIINCSFSNGVSEIFSSIYNKLNNNSYSYGEHYVEVHSFNELVEHIGISLSIK